MLRISCGYCDKCFPIVEATTSLREHIKSSHPLDYAIDYEMIPVNIRTHTSAIGCENISPATPLESYNLFNDDDYLSDISSDYGVREEDVYAEEIEVIRGTPEPAPVRVDYDLWDTASAWNSLNKDSGI